MDQHWCSQDVLPGSVSNPLLPHQWLCECMCTCLLTRYLWVHLCLDTMFWGNQHVCVRLPLVVHTANSPRASTRTRSCRTHEKHFEQGKLYLAKWAKCDSTKYRIIKQKIYYHSATCPMLLWNGKCVIGVWWHCHTSAMFMFMTLLSHFHRPLTLYQRRLPSLTGNCPDSLFQFIVLDHSHSAMFYFHSSLIWNGVK